MLTLHVFQTPCPTVYSWAIDEWRIAADGGFDGGPHTLADGVSSSKEGAYGAGVEHAKTLGLRIACGDPTSGYELVRDTESEVEVRAEKKR